MSSYSRYFGTGTVIALIMVTVGCHSHPSTASKVFHRNMQSLSAFYTQNQEVPTEVLYRVPGQIKQLKPGMSPSAVFHQLGLDSYGFLGDALGPANNYFFGCELRTNCWMGLWFDMSKEPPTFLRSVLFGDGWQ